MLGSFLTRGLVLVFGYAYPAYECYKTVEKNKPEIEQLLFWCQYWVPMYSEAKLAFFIYLWYPKTKGTTYVYDSFFRPYLAKYENEIDRNLLELRTQAGDMAILYWQRAVSQGQTRIFEIMQFIAAQSTPRPRPAQPQQQVPIGNQATATLNRQSTGKSRVETDELPSPMPSISSSQDQKEVAGAAGPSNSSESATSVETSAQPPSATVEVGKAEAVVPAANEKPELPPEETVMEETLRRTRGRLRKARSALNRKETETITGS